MKNQNPNEQVKDIIDNLTALMEDPVVPKNVKFKIEIIIQILHEEQELSIKVNKALHELDEIADDSNMQPFTRTQLWNVVSMLETL